MRSGGAAACWLAGLHTSPMRLCINKAIKASRAAERRNGVEKKRLLGLMGLKVFMWSAAALQDLGNAAVPSPRLCALLIISFK